MVEYLKFWLKIIPFKKEKSIKWVEEQNNSQSSTFMLCENPHHKTIVGNYGFVNFLKCSKLYINYGFKFKFKVIVTNYDFKLKYRVIYINLIL